MSTQDSADRTAYAILGMVLGVAAGIGVGMLLAPRSGEETRNRIRDRAMTAKQKAKYQMASKRDAAFSTLNKTLDKSKELVDKAADKTKDTVDTVSERTKDAADQAQAETNRRRSRSTS
jgi:gas vesicle protein